MRSPWLTTTVSLSSSVWSKILYALQWKKKRFFNNDLFHFFESRLDNDTSVTMTWNRGSMVKPHFHASHLRTFISYTQASLSHYSPKSLLHRPLYLISVVHDAPPSRQFWYRIMVSRLNDASKASSSLLFSWGGSGEVTPAKSLMRAKSSSTAYDTGKRKHLSSNSHCLITLRKHKFAAHSSFPALPANQKGGLLILSTANVWWEIIPTMPYCAKKQASQGKHPEGKHAEEKRAA